MNSATQLDNKYHQGSNDRIELTIIMPCLNEIETLGSCIQKAQDFLDTENICGEIIIGDNGSSDGSIDLALSMGVQVVNIPQKGYGAALLGALAEAKGSYVIMGDSDDSYDFLNLMPFVDKLRDGYDLVMGNRFKGGIEKGAMPFLHRYLGNPVLSFLGRLFFRSTVGDFHCGLRAFDRLKIEQLNLQCSGMEFASEMVVKSVLQQLKIGEVPINLSVDGRSTPPHLNTWSDGWRHLRFLLLYSPAWLFLMPGAVLFMAGFICTIVLMVRPVQLLSVELDVHTLIYTATSTFIGLQFILFFAFSRHYAYLHDLLPKGTFNQIYQRYFSLERGLMLGTLMLVAGIGLTIYAWLHWKSVNFGALSPRETLRWVVPAIFLIISGIQIIQSSFFMSFIELKSKQK